MKKILPFLAVMAFLSATTLLAQQGVNSTETSARSWNFGSGITVTWSFINVIASPGANNEAGPIMYNAMLTIVNNTCNDIQDWNIIVNQEDQITQFFGAGLRSKINNSTYNFQSSPISKNVIPAHGSHSITYTAVAQGEIHRPAILSVSTPVVPFETNPYNE